MVARSDSVCKYICEAGDWRVTNLQLQKILYVAQMACLGIIRERLTDVWFEAWDHGPVAPKVYRQVRMYGASPIVNVFHDALPFGENSKRREILADACRDLLPMRPGQLVEITHWKHGAWARHYIPGARGTVIPDESIVDEYRKRIQVGHIQAD